LKWFNKIALMVSMALMTSGVLLAQSAQSRLNVGKDGKKAIVSTKATTPGFGKMPEKINFSSKTEYTQYYRNLLLNQGQEKKAETAAVSGKSHDTHADKIRFGNMYPNPAVDFVEIPYDAVDTFKEARVTVMSMVGSPLLEFPVTASGSKLKMNTSTLESGIYMVQFVVDGKKVGTKKLLVEKN
jgi:DNA polymerase III sliding clamp (beta) subunit (PCNA family)